jgi:hypothetical protein
MACTTQTKNFRLEAANIYFGKEDITCITPDNTLTGGEYFKISTPAIKYAVWTEVNLVGTAPVVAGYTIVKVTVGAAYTVAQWIAAFKTALEATDNFLVTASTDGLSCKAENLEIGAPLEVAVDVDTSFVFANLQTGFGGSLGKTKEGIEVTFETTLFDVLSNQNGETLEDQIIQGHKASLTASLLEITEDNLKNIISKSLGDELTPPAGTIGIGYGTSKNFLSTFTYAGKLILHPVRLASTDRTKDFCFWKCIPLADSIAYDGTDTQALSVSFNALVDDTKDNAINLCIFGDWKQDFR